MDLVSGTSTSSSGGEQDLRLRRDLGEVAAQLPMEEWPVASRRSVAIFMRTKCLVGDNHDDQHSPCGAIGRGGHQPALLEQHTHLPPPLPLLPHGGRYECPTVTVFLCKEGAWAAGGGTAVTPEPRRASVTSASEGLLFFTSLD